MLLSRQGAPATRELFGGTSTTATLLLPSAKSCQGCSANHLLRAASTTDKCNAKHLPRAAKHH